MLQGPTFGSPLAPIKSSFQTWSKPLAVYSLHFCSANDAKTFRLFPLTNAAQLRARAGAHAHQLLIHSVYGLGTPFAVTGPSSRFRHVVAGRRLASSYFMRAFTQLSLTTTPVVRVLVLVL